TDARVTEPSMTESVNSTCREVWTEPRAIQDGADDIYKVLGAELECRHITATWTECEESCCQFRHSRHACSITNSPKPWICPLSSAMGINVSGDISPRSACRHRASASNRTIFPHWMFHSGS